MIAELLKDKTPHIIIAYDVTMKGSRITGCSKYAAILLKQDRRPGFYPEPSDRHLVGHTFDRHDLNEFQAHIRFYHYSAHDGGLVYEVNGQPSFREQYKEVKRQWRKSKVA